MKPSFVHLRLHTEYSVTNGLLQIPVLMEKVAQLRMPALALTDQGNLYAAVKFYQSAYQFGIKPIIGIDINVTDDGSQSYRLTLLCQNQLGYQNLLKLVSQSFLEGQKNDQPLIHRDWLSPYSLGLIAISGGIEGNIGQALLAGDFAQAKSSLILWQALFPDRFYLEVSRIGRPNEASYIEAAAEFAARHSIPLVATNEACFLGPSDFEAHEARVCIQMGVTLNDPNRPRLYQDQQYLRTPAEMASLFSDMPEALENTIEISKRCNLILTLGKNRLPKFTVPKTYTTEAYLSELTHTGLMNRLTKLFNPHDPDFDERCKPYHERLSKELSVINAMGFAGYFLIVADFTDWAKKNDIPVGPGRGSGPGSLVAYALGITGIDPLPLGLIFERFLNPERISMPDFDIDFCVENRDRVIEYVMDQHGHESVAHIITYGTMAAKAVVRDVGRVLGMPYGFVDKIAKLIPFELGITLEKALTQEPLLKDRYNTEDEVKTLIDLALKLEGVIRNVGKHAGGIVIAPGKLTDFVPLYCEPNAFSHPVTQFDKDDVEAVGLVKFDFLGLKTLTIINRALQLINQEQVAKKESLIDINLIPLNDEKTFTLLKDHKTIAIFQLESHGMRDLIKRLQPDCFEDLIALVALFRPGPLQSGMVDDFINRKHGRAKVVYPHPKLASILGTTYGVIVYQEQVMKIAQVLAGYTLGAADILRKAMGKKQPEEMAKQREIFCKGAIKNGVNEEVAHYIFDQMEKFAGYGFNKSHSASYALIAYQTAWLKVHHPAAFMAAVLSSDMDKTEKVLSFLEECKNLNLIVDPPDINQSDFYFKFIDGTHLLYGLGAIKGVGESAIENIIATRNKTGLFKNLLDFCERVDLRKVNKRVFEALIKSGCFDSFGKDRAVLMATLPIALQQAEQALHNKIYGQQDLLGMAETDVPFEYAQVEPWSEDFRLAAEKQTLGFYLTGHPLNRYTSELSHLTTCRLNQLTPSQKSIRVAGIISTIRSRQTKRGDRIAVFYLDDGTARIEAVCFKEVYQNHRALLIEDQFIIMEADTSIDEFNQGIRLTAQQIFTIELARAKFAKHLQLKIENTASLDVEKLASILHPFKNGTCAVVLSYIQDMVQMEIKLSQQWMIHPKDELIQAISHELWLDAELKY